ncbi:HEAT repeat domain-containing protein [Telmatocola sphagniphila]|uniref:HEAT repeat domain-containing protein n=1 Tax=Telmatocola sphagniphila TaxID=1123043 RepID=A0A8E6EU68_9BACT|nr:HEAT repeat domain-containing protein [Telmatocola sphagniphila]QVL33334.1 HEAT repeat domain-containing protein [Telmatocola sphagniphila]
MANTTLTNLNNELATVLATGIDQADLSHLKEQVSAKVSEDLPENVVASLKSIHEADQDEIVWPILETIDQIHLAEVKNLFVNVPGELEEFEAGPSWSTPMLTQAVYALVPESRPFAKRVKPEEQITMLESTNNDGTITDLRLLQIYLQALSEKKTAPVYLAMLELALPAFGKDILPDLWPTLSPESRSFQIAYKLDMQAALTKLQEKSGGKKTDRGGPVIKAVEKLLDEGRNDYGEISPDSLPILKLGIKLAADAPFRRKIADTLAGMGDIAKSALPELIEAFERGGLTRDYQLIRPMMVLGKESKDVADALTRALEDRDASVRLMAAFNLGQMGAPAFSALNSLEDMVSNDTDVKVRDQATKTLNKLRARLEPPVAAE